MGFKRFFLGVFGKGELPPEGQRFVESEGGRIVLESLEGSITFRNYRAPGRYSSWRRQGFLGSLALTKVRIVGYGFSRRVVNIPLADKRIQEVEFSVPRPGVLQISFESSLFISDTSGQIDIRFTTPRAEELQATLLSLCRPA